MPLPNAPFLHCRLCGMRYRSDKVSEHEKQCSYQNSTSGKAKEAVPASSKDSNVNKIRDTEEYYMQTTKSSESSEKKPKDLKSNEESDDSPLNLGNRVHKVRESEEYHEKPGHSHSVTETKTVKKSTSGSNNRPTERYSKTEVETTHDKSKDSDVKTETKTYYGPDGKVIKTESKTTYSDPESHEDSSVPTTPHNSHEEERGSDSKNKGKPSTNLSSYSSGMSANHKKSHSNEKAGVKIKSKDSDDEKVSGQKSDEEQKAAMMSTPYPSEEDISLPSMNADEIGEAADALQHLPELDENAEMAYEKHKNSLVPCTHCERTFRPDRLAVHEKACIERPKTREYIVPEDKQDKKPDQEDQKGQ